MTRLRLTLLGGFDARLDGQDPIAFTRRKAQALLAYLALAPGQAHPRDKLAALLWGDATDERARQSLRQVLVELRRLGTPALVEHGDTVAIDPAAIDVDVAAFERLVATGTVTALAEAAALYRGDLLAGLGAQESAFEEWLQTERERLRELAMAAHAKLLAARTKTGAVEPAIQSAVRLLGFDPTQEAVHRALMRLYVQQGRRGAALRQYQLCVSLLDRELGAAPEQETRELYQHLLQRQPSAAPAMTERTGASLTDAPLIGRDAELALLAEAREAAWRGQGAIVVLRGEAGIGKSRLIDALVADTARAGGHVLVGRAWDTERILPFGPWVDALRGGQVVPDLVDDLAAPWRNELARLFPELGAPPLETAAEDHLRLFEAMTRVVEHLAARNPLLIVLEDLHWADEMSVRLLAFVARRVVSRPVLLAATVRAEELADAALLRRVLAELDRHPRSRTIELSRLSEPQTAALLRALSATRADEALNRARAAQVWRISEGNPFMAVETVRAIRDGDAATTAEVSAPARVRDMIAGRLEQLTEPARELASVAAVVGREFDFDLIIRAAGVSAVEGARGIEQLVGRQILHAVGEHFDFTHDLIRDVAHGQLLPPRRALLHGAIARALAEVHAVDPGPHMLAVGRHSFASGDWERAVTCLAAAGRAAAERSAHREAVACFEQALAALEHLPPTRVWIERAIDVRLEIRNSLHTLGELPRMLDGLRAAETLARSIGDEVRRGFAEGLLTHCLTMLGRHDEAAEYGRRATTTATATGHVMLRHLSNFYFGQTYYFRGEFTAAEAMLQSNVTALGGALERERFGFPTAWSVVSRAFLALCLAERGEFDEALAHGRAILTLTEELQDPWGIFHSCLALGRTHVVRGEFERAVEVLRHGLAVSQERELLLGVGTLAPQLVHALASAGHVDEALAAAETLGTPALPHLLCLLGDTYLIAGRREEATLRIDRGLEICAARHERGFEAWGRLMAGQLAATATDTTAETAFRQALDLARAAGMRPLIAHCHRAIGELHLRRGRDADARAAIAAAVAIYRETGMTYWLRRAEDALVTSTGRGL